MQALCVAWLIPAIGLVWTGFAATGLRSLTEAEVTASLERLQAMVVMLGIFSVPIGCTWALRTWSHVPALTVIESKRAMAGPLGHLVALAISALAVFGLVAVGVTASRLAWVAALAGCHAGLLLTRWLQYAPLVRSFPVVVLSAGAVAQTTVGWMHVVNPGGRLSALLVVEGLALAWAAIAAARVIAMGEPARQPVQIPAERGEAVVQVAAASDAEATVDLISQAPALQSLPEPAVGH